MNSTLLCPSCGAEVPADASFCPSCGLPISSDENFASVRAQAPLGNIYAYPPTAYGYTEAAQTDTMGVWGYTWPILLNIVPGAGGVVAIILFFIWGFGSYGPNRKNFSRAMLLINLIIVLVLLLSLIIAILFLGISYDSFDF